MYIPKHFQLDEEEMIYDFIEKYSFPILFSQHNVEPYATHLPLTLNKDENALYGHFARPNPQWKDIQNQTVLTVFHVLIIQTRAHYKTVGADSVFKRARNYLLDESKPYKKSVTLLSPIKKVV